jgi:hypothetical protein
MGLSKTYVLSLVCEKYARYLSSFPLDPLTRTSVSACACEKIFVIIIINSEQLVEIHRQVIKKLPNIVRVDVPRGNIVLKKIYWTI